MGTGAIVEKNKCPICFLSVWWNFFFVFLTYIIRFYMEYRKISIMSLVAGVMLVAKLSSDIRVM